MSEGAELGPVDRGRESCMMRLSWKAQMGGFDMGRKREPHRGTQPALDAVAGLQQSLEAMGRPAKGDAHRGTGRDGTWYLRHAIKQLEGGSRTPLSEFLGLLLGAGITPSRHFARTAEASEDPVYALIRDARKRETTLASLPAGIRTAPRRGRSRSEKGGTTPEIERLDRLRYIDPQRAATLASRALSEARGARAVARLLGVWASAQRMCYRLDWATVALGEAMALADLFELDMTLAELAQRASVLMLDRGEMDWGLQFARRAAATYLQRGEYEHFGRALVDCAMLLANDGQSAASESMCRAALALTASATNQCSAWQHIAIARTLAGDLDRAQAAIQRAEAVAPEGAQLRARLAWRRGLIASEQGRFAAADRALTSALEQLQGAPFDAVLVGAQLVRVRTRAGNAVEAAALAATLRWYDDELRRDPLDVDQALRAALADLVKAGEEARVTESLVDEVIQRILDLVDSGR